MAEISAKRLPKKCYLKQISKSIKSRWAKKCDMIMSKYQLNSGELKGAPVDLAKKSIIKEIKGINVQVDMNCLHLNPATILTSFCGLIHLKAFFSAVDSPLVRDGEDFCSFVKFDTYFIAGS